MSGVFLKSLGDIGDYVGGGGRRGDKLRRGVAFCCKVGGCIKGNGMIFE